MASDSARPQRKLGTPTIRRVSSTVAFALLTGCQLLFGDFDVVPKQSGADAPSSCLVASTYLCQGSTLYVCVDAGQKPTELLECAPPLRCDPVEGHCSGDVGASSASTTGASVAVTAMGGVGGSVSRDDDPEMVAGDGATDAAAGAPPESGECDPSVDDCCPDDPNKTGPGLCGCGVVDTSECAALRAALAHRYGFTDLGATALDSVGGAHGTIMNAEVVGAGSLELAGGDSDEYVDLPNGILSVLTNATIEAWLSWRGGDSWQRVFDFGNNDSGEAAQGTGTSYLFLTPSSNASTLRVAITADGPGAETLLEAAAPLMTEASTHVAVVVDDDNDLLALYLDGVEQGTVEYTGQLAMLDDVNNWLGRSQFSADPEMGATLDEVRIYRAALTSQQIMASYQGGTDPAFLTF